MMFVTFAHTIIKPIKLLPNNKNTCKNTYFSQSNTYITPPTTTPTHTLIPIPDNFLAKRFSGGS